MNRNSTSKWSKLMNLLFGAFLAILLLEIGLRVNPKTQVLTWPFFIPDDELGWVYRPNMDEKNIIYGIEGRPVNLQTNSLGYRNAPEPEDIPPDAFVIAIQGDSQIAGYGLEYEETMAYQLQEILNDRFPEIEIVVIDAGVDGYDVNHYYTQAQKLVHQYEIDVLIMAFNLENDDAASALVNVYYIPRPYWMPQEDGQLVLVHPENKAERGKLNPPRFISAYAAYDDQLAVDTSEVLLVQVNNMLRHSYLYLTLRDSLFSSKRGYEPEDFRKRPVLNPYNGAWKYAQPMPEPYATHYGIITDILSEWNTLSSSKNFILILPELTSPAHREATREVFAENNLGVPDFDLPGQRIKTLADSLSIPVINPIDAFRQANGQLFIAHNSHYTSYANSILAKVTADALTPLLEKLDD